MLNNCMPLPNGELTMLDESNYELFFNWAKDTHSFVSIQEFMTKSEKMTFKGVESLSICEFVRSVIHRRSFFTTALEYAGLMNNLKVEDGDELWVLAGGSHPVVLRPARRVKGYFKPFREAYVHGIIQSEVVRGECPIKLQDGIIEPVIAGIREGEIFGLFQN